MIKTIRNKYKKSKFEKKENKLVEGFVQKDIKEEVEKTQIM